ncbi:MAG: AAA family ATPase, partial [Anaerolineae bacterium]|nr:AAA family ATPase [Anaerolineae bacterium]
EIRGHRRTYIGALPGRILQTMRRVTTVNPVFMMDEIDKLGLDFRGDPAAALLEVLDPEQNHEYGDHYLDLPYDLSKVLFITTANQSDSIPAPLLDRMEVIEFPGYTEDDKLAIARQFLVPRQLEQHGLERSGLAFDDETLLAIMHDYTYEAGVRNLEREIANVCRKVARRIAEGKAAARVTPGNLHKYLGPPKRLHPMILEEEDEIGVATGVAWSVNGGSLMAVEVSLMPGKGNLQLTGHLGDIMRESAQAAMSYTRANAERFGVAVKDFETRDVHIHVPEGAIPKDGPSAGITLCTALVSAFTRRKVRRAVAMTGEITLRGRVLPVGGVREKLLAAYRAGVRTMILPQRNDKDLDEIPESILNDMEIILVGHMEQVLDVALHGGRAPGDSVTPRRSGRRAAGTQPPARV